MRIDFNNHSAISALHSKQDDPYDIDLKIAFKPGEDPLPPGEATASMTCRGSCVSCGMTCRGTCDC